MAEASTGDVAQPGAAQARSVSVLAKGDVGGYVLVPLSNASYVAELAEAVIPKLGLVTTPNYVQLTKLDGTPLVSDRTLAAEGVADGTRIIATVVAPPPPATTAVAAPARPVSPVLDSNAVSDRLHDLSAHEVQLFLYKKEFAEFRRKLKVNALNDSDVNSIKIKLSMLVQTSTRQIEH
jgi:hypothetical protein